jgi:transcriptional regulator with XRE-family HTH domain
MMKQRKYKLIRHYTDLGSALQSARERVGLTQREVSVDLGYSSAQFISNFERGISAPPLKKLKTLAKRYRMSTTTVTRLMLAGQERKIHEALS